jgi:hypothetical protein
VNVDVLAPGGAGTGCQDSNGIYSTFPGYQVTLTSNVECPPNYAYLSGTSFPSPAAAGLAALVWSLSPELGPGEVSQVITSTAEYLGSPFYNGYGRIDALAAAQAVSAPPGTPLLLPVSNSDHDGSYQVEWAAVPGSAGYTLQEASDPSFSDLVVRYTGPENKVIVSDQAAGIWHYRVRARLSGGESAWSTIQTAGVTPAAPTLAGVENAGQMDEYSLAWTPVLGASGYSLEEASNPEFSGARLRYRGPETGYRVTGQPGGAWYYRVRAYNLAGGGSWSAGANTVVNPPLLIAPRLQEILNDDRNGDFSLFWNDIDGAAGYLVEWSSDPYFSHPEPPFFTSISQLSIAGRPGGNWYVRVRAVSSAGNSPWSSPMHTVVLLRTNLPILLSGFR